MTSIKNIDGKLLTAILNGGKIIKALSRTNENSKLSAHVAIVEMPKDIIVEELRYTNERKYWKYLVFVSTPEFGWQHYSSNNLNKVQNIKKAWDEWSELKRHIKENN